MAHIRSGLLAVLLFNGWAMGATVTVQPGEVIVEAINKAKAGDVIEVMPGEYRQNIDIAIPGITVRGLEKNGERVVLNGKYDDEAEPLNCGISVSANNVTVEGFSVQNFGAIGLMVADCKDVIARDVLVTGGGTAGVAVERAQRVTLDGVVAGNSNGDAAISLNGAVDCSVSRSEGYASSAGLQLNNTEQIRVENSGFYGNRVGILVGLGAAPSVKPPTYTTIRRCRIVGNNGAAVVDYRSPYSICDGTGIVIWGASQTEIVDCVIAQNETLGIATLASDSKGVRHQPKDAPRAGAPSEFTYVHHNIYAGNGTAPAKMWAETFPGIPAGDLYWDELGERNQFQENAELKTYPKALVVKQGGVHTNVIHFQ